MIERYFLKGVRLKWAFPGMYGAGAKDGSIVANMPLAAGPMVYDGLDGDLYDLGMPNIAMTGLRMGMQIPYSWLTYAPGHTTKRMLAAGDMLTGFMSGCVIATWMENGCRFVGHVGTDVGRHEQNLKVKKAFSDYMPRDTTGFLPSTAWDDQAATLARHFKFATRPQVMALVNTAGEFFSILVIQFGQSNDWCVGGIKKMAPMNRDALYLHLRKLNDR